MVPSVALKQDGSLLLSVRAGGLEIDKFKRTRLSQPNGLLRGIVQSPGTEIVSFPIRSEPPIPVSYTHLVIPLNSITKPPSAELRPGQKDSDSLPPYDILDSILYQYIEKKMGPKEIVALGNDEALVKRILRMVNINEFKREQTAPVIRVSCKAFGMGRRVPIVGKYLG